MKSVRLLGIFLLSSGILLAWTTYGDFAAAHSSYSTGAESIPLIGPFFRMLDDFTRLATAGFFFASFFPIAVGLGFLIVPESEWKSVFLPKPAQADQPIDAEKSASEPLTDCNLKGSGDLSEAGSNASS